MEVLSKVHFFHMSFSSCNGPTRLKVVCHLGLFLGVALILFFSFFIEVFMFHLSLIVTLILFFAFYS